MNDMQMETPNCECSEEIKKLKAAMAKLKEQRDHLVQKDYRHTKSWKQEIGIVIAGLDAVIEEILNG